VQMRTRWKGEDPERRPDQKNGRTLREIQLSLRRAKVAELALKGWTQQAIADFFELSVACIQRDLGIIKEEWRLERVQNTDLYVRRELLQLDTDEHDIRRRLLGLPDNAIETVLKAYSQILRVMQRRSKMLGLDAPAKLQISVEQVHIVAQQIIAVVVDEVHDPDMRERIGQRILQVVAPHTEEEQLGHPQTS